MATQKLSSYSVALNDGKDWYSIIEKLLSLNTEQSHCTVNEQIENYIGGCFIYESLCNKTVYNIAENKFETVMVPKQNIVKFDIFTNSGFMFLWGNRKAAALFVTTMEQASNHSIIIDYNNTDFKTMIKRLLIDKSAKFLKMKITDIIIENGIVANCSVNLSNHDDYLYLINKFIDNIVQMTVTIGGESDSVSLALYSTGSVVVFKDRDDIDDEAMNSINIMIGGVK